MICFLVEVDIYELIMNVDDDDDDDDVFVVVVER